MLMLTTSRASAYNLEPARWNGQPSPGYCCADITVGREATHSATQTAWSNGISAWNNSPAYIWFDQPSSYKVGLADIDDSANSYDGLTTYYYLPLFGYFSSMSAWLNFHWIKSYSVSKAQGVAAHELGHVAGLDHTSGCVLMTPYSSTRASCGVSTPQSDDIHGIAAIY
jgi:hypothetical protein